MHQWHNANVVLLIAHTFEKKCKPKQVNSCWWIVSQHKLSDLKFMVQVYSCMFNIEKKKMLIWIILWVLIRSTIWFYFNFFVIPFYQANHFIDPNRLGLIFHSVLIRLLNASHISHLNVQIAFSKICTEIGSKNLGQSEFTPTKSILIYV